MNQLPRRNPRTRLAPSPTGALHLGNARTFVLNYILARQRGWDITLRVDDIDGPRVRSGAEQQAIDDLRWLGLEWDQGPLRQSDRLAAHHHALETLINCGAVYPCVCTRAEIDRAASAPHSDDGATIYPNTCRGRFRDADHALRQTGRAPAWRFEMPARSVEFVDEIKGPCHFDPAGQLGDFVVAKPDRTPAYQLATVCDDSATGVTHVVRGDDLLDSTPRQILLYHALQLESHVPSYIHLPLVRGGDGRRLAKRHGDTRIATLRHAGVPPTRVLGWIARRSGVGPVDAISLPELTASFDLNALPKHDITLDPADLARLLEPTRS